MLKSLVSVEYFSDTCESAFKAVREKCGEHFYLTKDHFPIHAGFVFEAFEYDVG